ncbi:hypothetical protein VTN02DRAFT_5220 [Thermoascus thermophilus]
MVGLKRFFHGRLHRPSFLGQGDVASKEFDYLQGIDLNPYGSPTGQPSPRRPPPGPPPVPPALKSPRALDVDQHLRGIERQFEQLHKLDSASSAVRSSRHIDVVEALITSHRDEINVKWSPITPYNEDVADRNMDRRKEGRQMSRSRASSTYQEDMTDRQSDRGRRRSRTPVRESKMLGDKIRVTTSQEDLRLFPRPPTSIPTRATQTRPTSSLRSQRSAPSLSVEQAEPSQNTAACSSTGHLDVPRGRKTGESPRNRSVSRKNVRDLSINTELAASGRQKIEHCAIQPPTPRQYLAGPGPSIAEIVNSPMPAVIPQPTASYDVEEIMDMFRQAYKPSQPTSPHPTFETLHDAIIREINSHEAFRNLPVPDMGPAFTPSPSQETFGSDITLVGSGSSQGSGSSDKENQVTRLILKGSLGRMRRNSDAVSKVFPPTNTAKGHDKVFKRGPDLPLPGRRRRHTYGQPPTPGLIESVQRDQQVQGGKFKEDGTLRSGLPKVLHGRAKSDSKRIPSPREASAVLNRQPSVRRMRAHSSASVRASRIDFSPDHDKDCIIPLPHVDGPPHVQIRSVDDNNVTYIFNAKLPIDPEEMDRLTRGAPKKNATASNTADRVPSNPMVPLNEKRIPLRKDQVIPGQLAW